MRADRAGVGVTALRGGGAAASPPAAGAAASPPAAGAALDGGTKSSSMTPGLPLFSSSPTPAAVSTICTICTARFVMQCFDGRKARSPTKCFFRAFLRSFVNSKARWACGRWFRKVLFSNDFVAY
eukprot:tig00021374_g21140.t1